MLATVEPASTVSEASVWLENFSSALSRSDYAAAAAQFVSDSHWRDLLAFTWRFQDFAGPAAIEEGLRQTVPQVTPGGFRVAPNRTPPRHVRRVGRDVLEVIFNFETRLGRCAGVVRLVPDETAGGQLRAWTFLTAIEELKGFEERRAGGDAYTRDFGGENWLDKRKKELRYEDREPTVLVVGGGHAGIGIAARLGQLGIDALIVDRMKRIGDNWRNRYHALKLHNETYANDLPYLPFPKSWPIYIPKDKMANWLESYVEIMELNFWTETEFVGGTFDDKTQTWTARVRGSDGTERVFHPRHIVFATGVSGIPIVPTLPGLADFKGQVMHSSAFADGKAWKGRSAIVIGTGNSGHDVAQELYSYGADVTIVQRGSTNIVSVNPSARLGYALYAEGAPAEDCDLLASSFAFPVLKAAAQMGSREMRRLDTELLEKLTAVGFNLDFGTDNTGYQMSFMARGGGYYLNVGCSDLIIEKKIRLLQYADIDGFAAQGARLRDGTIVPADLIVLATGFKPQEELVRKLLGNDVAERIGPVWGLGADGQLRNMWTRTKQKGLWFTAGSLAQSRTYSRYLAILIKALEQKLIS